MTEGRGSDWKIEGEVLRSQLLKNKRCYLTQTKMQKGTRFVSRICVVWEK